MGCVCIRNYVKKMLFRLQAHIFFSLYFIWRKKALKSYLLSFKGWSLSQTFRIRYLIDLSNLQTDILIYIRKYHVFVCLSLYDIEGRYPHWYLYLWFEIGLIRYTIRKCLVYCMQFLYCDIADVIFCTRHIR